LKNEIKNYETRDLESSDSGGYIHLDGGTDRIRNDELHGARPDSILKNTELNKRICRHLNLMPAGFLLGFRITLLIKYATKYILKIKCYWKIQSELTPRANVSLTPENFLILTP